MEAAKLTRSARLSRPSNAYSRREAVRKGSAVEACTYRVIWSEEDQE